MTRVLVTRAEPDASDFAAACRAAGLEPVLSPVMRIEIETAPVDLKGVSALAFTSANGVRAFAANSHQRSLPVFAVGPVTAKAAADAGFETIHVAGGDVEALASHVASESAYAGKEILHIAGADRAGDLMAMLKARGLASQRQSLYRAAPEDALSKAAAAAIVEGQGLWVTLFSPRTAALFLDLVGRAGLLANLSGVRAVCLSEAVAQAAAGAGWREVVIAPDRTAQSVIDAVLTRRGA